MKNLLFIAALLTVGFVACDTPQPTTTDPADSSSINSNKTTDTAATKTDTTRTQ